jgi:hypothetical protein
MCGVLCGLYGLSEPVIYAESKILFFKQHFGIKKLVKKSSIKRGITFLD